MACTDVHGFAHVTGGGLEGNLTRIIPDGLSAIVDLPAPPPLFAYIAARGVSAEEVRRVFNMGIGLIAVCDPNVVDILQSDGEIIGRVEANNGTERKVIFRDDRDA